MDNKLSSKLGTRTSLKTVITKYNTTRTCLYNSTVYTATKLTSTPNFIRKNVL